MARVAGRSLLLLRQRIELASMDVEEELLRFAALLAGILAAVLLAALALAAAAAGLVVFYWDSARLAALGGVAAFFAAASGLVAWRLSCALRAKPRFMAATLAELDKDGGQLSASA